MSDRYVFFAFFSFCNFQFYSVFIPLNYHCLNDIFQNLFLLEFSRSSKLDIMLSKLITTATTTFSFYDSIYLFIYSLHIDYYVSSFLFYTNFPIHILYIFNEIFFSNNKLTLSNRCAFFEICSLIHTGCPRIKRSNFTNMLYI